jgi:phosphoribosylaminoimidazole-succinocarboxamide synthase
LVSRAFSANPRRRDFDLTDRQLVELCVESAMHASELPLYHRGESTEIRRTAIEGLLLQRLTPSLNSITHRRKGTVAGTDRLRHDISRFFWAILHRHQIPTCHLAYHDEHVLISEERIPPVEVIVKAAMVGTPSRIYHGLLERTDRFGRRFEAHQDHEPYVRFDYRNPLRSPSGQLLRDECMPLALADRLIDTRRATASALAVFDVVRTVGARVELEVLDACFLFDETGRTLAYEISPDNMRVKGAGWRAHPRPIDEFDKDLWRHGADDAQITEQWNTLRARLERLEE